ncbi:MAG: HAMP domain-containing histidine kinase [Lachnospiraceae bacterium]|nr:HAMP domain-containing histidine kinase [Lachnospiraceae bacterium]
MEIREKWEIKGYLLIYMLVLFVVLTISYLVQIRSEQRHEEENVDMVYQMLGELRQGISYEQVAADMLKGTDNPDAVRQGLSVLEEYGYDGDYVSVFTGRTKEYARKLAVFYLALYLLLFLLYYSILQLMKKSREREFQQIGEILERFYNGQYEYLTEAFGEGTKNRIYMQLNSLGQKIILNEQRIELEKEDTKAMITDLSHQLKTPVASIKMCFQLLEDENLKTEEKKEFLERLGEQVVSLEGLLGALVNISRMEAGMIEIHKERNNIFDTVVQAVNQVYMKAEEKGIEIAIESEEEDNQKLFLPHDVKWTREAIVNVLDNAVKYSPANSQIRIKLIKQLYFLQIEIRDEGIGIKKDEVNRIFQRFYRGKHEVVRQAEGSGVGLYLTRKILEEQGGNIVVVISRGKKEPKGSTFSIMLPLQ